MNLQINKCRALTVILLVGIYQISAQIHQEKSLYDAFDDQFGPQNMGINNGTLHLNSDRSDNKTHRYYLNNTYLQGDVAYDGQVYSEAKLKYDIYTDVLVAKVSGEYNTVGINLITEKTHWFHIGNTKFINLTFQKNNTLPHFITGFYELVDASKGLVLYIKHHKEKAEVVRPEGKFTNFDTSDSFIIWYNNNYYLVQSQSDFTFIFPHLDQQIGDFYQFNRELRKTDQKQFMRKLVQTVASLLPKDIR